MTCLHSLAVSHDFLIAANITGPDSCCCRPSVTGLEHRILAHVFMYSRAHKFCHLLQFGSAHVSLHLVRWQELHQRCHLYVVFLQYAQAVYPSPGISASVHVKLWLHDGPVLSYRMCVSASSQGDVRRHRWRRPHQLAPASPATQLFFARTTFPWYVVCCLLMICQQHWTSASNVVAHNI